MITTQKFNYKVSLFLYTTQQHCLMQCLLSLNFSNLRRWLMFMFHIHDSCFSSRGLWPSCWVWLVWPPSTLTPTSRPGETDRRWLMRRWGGPTPWSGTRGRRPAVRKLCGVIMCIEESLALQSDCYPFRISSEKWKQLICEVVRHCAKEFWENRFLHDRRVWNSFALKNNVCSSITGSWPH